MIEEGAPAALNIIDGTFRILFLKTYSEIQSRPIARPFAGDQMGSLQRSVYSGHKVSYMLPYEHVHQCGHGLKYLGIVTPDGLISYMM